MSDSIMDQETDRDTDHNDLTQIQEYMIAGIVILLFGLLYWFLNHGWNSSSDLNLVAGSELSKSRLESNTGLQAGAMGATALAATSATNAVTVPDKPQTAITQTPINNKANDTAQTKGMVSAKDGVAEEQIAAPLQLTTQEIAELKAAEEALTKSNAEREQAAEETKNQAEAISKLESTDANTDAENSTEKAKPEQNTNDSTAKTDKDTGDKSQAENTTYTLPDGTKIDIEPNGFEGELKAAIINRELFKPIAFDSIYFESGSTTIKAESDHQLKATAALLHKHSNTHILLRGHTDSTGGLSRNVQLSLYRANATALALGKLGIDTKRIRIIGVGAAEPVASNETKEGRSKNRRIEVLITK